jgi:hypothetical protein
VAPLKRCPTSSPYRFVLYVPVFESPDFGLDVDDELDEPECVEPDEEGVDEDDVLFSDVDDESDFADFSDFSDFPDFSDVPDFSDFSELSDFPELSLFAAFSPDALSAFAAST